MRFDVTKIMLLQTLLLTVLSLPVATAVSEEPGSFCFVIGLAPAELGLATALESCSIVVVDGASVGSAAVSALKARGAMVLGYLSVGTIERQRWWFARVKKYRLDYWPDWQEWYANAAAEGYRNVLVDTVAPRILKRGYDGLFLDNVDMIADHPQQKKGMEILVRKLSALTRRRGRKLFAQNGYKIIRPFIRWLDGWNLEDAFSYYDFSEQTYKRQNQETVARNLAALRALKSRGLIVTVTDYVADGDSETAKLALLSACSAGAIPFISDIDLRRMPETPYTCRAVSGQALTPPG